MASLTEDRILDFLDGRLSASDEEELMHTLAVSPERRAVLRGHMRVRELTSNLASAERFSVPKHVTSQLFRSLQQMGLAATASTEEILSNAPQLTKFAAAEKALSTAATTLATSTGWQMSFASIVGASLLSFGLGAGAYHVFANGIGLHPFGQTAAPVIAQQQATTSIQRPATLSYAPITSAALREHPSADAPTVAPLSLTNQNPVAKPTAPAAMNVAFESGPAFSYAAPMEHSIIPSAENAPTTMAPEHLLATAIESPLETPRGTISVRYGAGVMPTNTITTWSSLQELRFRWTLLDYIVGSASLGELQSYVHQAIDPAPSSTSKLTEVRIGEVANNIMTIGAEAGITFDPIHIPIEATYGVMADGGGTVYQRAGLFAHYEPFQAMSIVAGFEGIWYQHDITPSVNQVKQVYSSYFTPNAKIRGPNGTETSGFFGPSIEFGWHF